MSGHQGRLQQQQQQQRQLQVALAGAQQQQGRWGGSRKSLTLLLCWTAVAAAPTRSSRNSRLLVLRQLQLVLRQHSNNQHQL
jgi:hypothetical protein